MDFLGNDETVIIRFRKHWIYIVIPGLVLIVLGIPMLLSVVGIFFLPPLLYPILRWWFDQLVLTNQAFYVRYGLISRDIKRIPLRNIQDISFTQGFWGRILGFGEVLISSAALGGLAGYKGIANPNEMVMSISQAIESAHQAQFQYPNQPPVNQYPNQAPANNIQVTVNQATGQPPVNQSATQANSNTETTRQE